MAVTVGTLKDRDGNIFLPQTEASLINGLSNVAVTGSYADLSDKPELSLQFVPGDSTLLLKSGNNTLSTIDVSNFSINGVLNYASFNNEILTLGFTSGQTVSINMTDILSDVLTEYTDKVEELENKHITMSESAYDSLVHKDADSFYYIYEE